MVYGTILKEKEWTKGNDKIKATKNTINYGLQGNDTYPSKIGSFNVSVDGSGNDKYLDTTGGAFGTMVIERGDSPKDLGTSSGFLTDPDTLIYTVDDRHLALINSVIPREIYLIDFAKPENQIEKIKTADGTFTFEQLSSQLQQLPNFAGNQTWTSIISQSAYLSDIGLTSSKKVNKFLKAVVNKAESLESNKTQDALLGVPSVGGDAARDSLLQPSSYATVDRRLPELPVDMGATLTDPFSPSIDNSLNSYALGVCQNYTWDNEPIGGRSSFNPLDLIGYSGLPVPGLLDLC